MSKSKKEKSSAFNDEIIRINNRRGIRSGMNNSEGDRLSLIVMTRGDREDDEGDEEGIV